MKRNYTLFQQYIAYVLLISLCLQSCGGGFDNNPLIPIQEEQLAPIQADAQPLVIPTVPTDNQPLLYKQLTAGGGHAVTFYKEAGELRANVAMNVPQVFSKSYEGLDVYIEQGTDLARLSCLEAKAQERRIRLQPAYAGKPAKIVIYKGAGLMGGGESEDEDEEEVTQSDLQQQIIPQTNIQSLGGQVLTAQRVHAVTCRVESGELKTDVVMSAPKGFSKIYKSSRVIGGMEGSGKEEGTAPKKILGEKVQKEAKIKTEKVRGRVILKAKRKEEIAKRDDKGKEKLTDDEEDAYLQYCLGIDYLHGLEREPNPKKALKWLQKSANQGYAYAQLSLGSIYELGATYEEELGITGITKDEQQAVYWYQKAADQGYADAQCNLAWMYKNGQGVAQDDEKAFDWFQKAAEQGFLNAQYGLGCMYENGWGVGKDERKAFEWYQKAADQGDPRAQCNLGLMFQNGLGVEKDYKKAIYWFQKAAKEQNGEVLLGPQEALDDYDTDSESEDELNFDSILLEKDNNDKVYIQSRLDALNNQLKTGNNDFSEYTEFIIPLFRGIHYLPYLFPNKSKRKNIRIASQEGLPLYSASVYAAAGLTAFNPVFDVEIAGLLERYAPIVKEVLSNLESLHLASHHKFHQVYSNDHKEFHNRLRNPYLESTAADSTERAQAFVHYKYLFYDKTVGITNFRVKEAIVRNPHVSFSIMPSHASNYALGNKSFYSPNGNKSILLLPDYDMNGKPKYPYLGKVYVAFLTLEDFFQYKPYMVVKNQASGNVRVDSHPRRNILKENEVTISGFLPGGKVVATRNIRCPRFDQEHYPDYYQSKYGIRITKWENHREKIKKQLTDKEKEEFKKSLYGHIADHQNSLLWGLAFQEATKRKKTLIYPGFENDFVLFPISARIGRMYVNIQEGKRDTISISPEGKEKLTVEEIIYVSRKLVGNTSIKEFKIYNYPIGEEGFKLFAQILSNSCLTTLVLQNTEPTEEGVKALTSSLAENKTLTELNINGNQAVGCQIETLVEALKNNDKLTRLDIGNIGLTTKGAKLLKSLFVGKIRANTTISWINLEGNSDVTEGMKNSIRNAIEGDSRM